MVTVLADDVWWVDLQGTNVFLVDDGALTLVDTGFPWQADRVRRAVGQVGSVGDVERVLLTHVDIDHVGGLGRLDGLDATVYVGREDRPYLLGEATPPWDNSKGALNRVTDLLRSATDLPVEAVADGDTVGSFTAYATPGHTPGHTCYVAGSLELGLLGDLVSASEPGRYELPPELLAYDADRARESLLEFADRTPDFAVGCQGHGTPVATDGAARVREAAARARN